MTNKDKEQKEWVFGWVAIGSIVTAVAIIVMYFKYFSI